MDYNQWSCDRACACVYEREFDFVLRELLTLVASENTTDTQVYEPCTQLLRRKTFVVCGQQSVFR